MCFEVVCIERAIELGALRHLAMWGTGFGDYDLCIFLFLSFLSEGKKISLILKYTPIIYVYFLVMLFCLYPERFIG